MDQDVEEEVVPCRQLHDSITSSSTGASAAAAGARSFLLYLGFLFRRPSKLFRPNRLDTWGGLRQLAISSEQNLSPRFIRELLRTKRGIAAATATVLPPLLVNASLGFLLFTSHSFFSLCLARLPLFDRGREEEITFDSLIQGPSIVPKHPTTLSAIAGAGAGVVQGLAFTPVENLVQLLKDSTSSLTGALARLTRVSDKETISLRQALKQFASNTAWHRSSSWWSGWRWTIARDACFFAAFDVTRRISLRVKAFFGGATQPARSNIVFVRLGDTDPSTIARVAQASTLVAGGISASLMAQAVARPIRQIQKMPPGTAMETFRKQGFRPFISENRPKIAASLMKRVGWRLAAVGPWGLSFVVWAWVGGEI